MCFWLYQAAASRMSSSESLSSASDWWTAGKWCFCWLCPSTPWRASLKKRSIKTASRTKQRPEISALGVFLCPRTEMHWFTVFSSSDSVLERKRLFSPRSSSDRTAHETHYNKSQEKSSGISNKPLQDESHGNIQLKSLSMFVLCSKKSSGWMFPNVLCTKI